MISETGKHAITVRRQELITKLAGLKIEHEHLLGRVSNVEREWAITEESLSDLEQDLQTIGNNGVEK